MLPIPSYSLRTLAASFCVATIVLSGCSSEHDSLNYDQALSVAANDLYKSRDRHYSLNSLSLVCRTATGPLQVEVVYNDERSFFKPQETKIYSSPTKCTEAGLLVYAKYKYRDGFNVRSKHAYIPALVVPEFEKALDQVYGKLTLNNEITTKLKGDFTTKLSEMAIREIDFICDSQNKVVVAGASVRGVYQEDRTRLACSVDTESPSGSYHAPIVAKVGLIGDASTPLEPTKKQKDTRQEYKMLTSASVSAAEGLQLVEEFLAKNTQKSSF